MKKIILWDSAKCETCKTKWDLPTLRERKDYKPGICPKCGGKLKTMKESENKKFQGGKKKMKSLKERQAKVNAQIDGDFSYEDYKEKTSKEANIDTVQKPKKEVKKMAVKKETKKVKSFTIAEMEKRAEVICNELKGLIDYKGLDLKFKGTNSWYCGWKHGSKCVFGMSYSAKGDLKVNTNINRKQFEASGLEGRLFEERYARFPWNGKAKDYAKICQVATDNKKAKLKPAKPAKPAKIVKMETAKPKLEKAACSQKKVQALAKKKKVKAIKRHI